MTITRDDYIQSETEDLVAEINNSDGQPRWKALQIEGIMEHVGSKWDEARALFDNVFAARKGSVDDKLQAAFDAVYLDDPDLAQYVMEAKEAEMEAVFLAYSALNPVVMRLAAAEQAEELALRRAMC